MEKSATPKKKPLGPGGLIGELIRRGVPQVAAAYFVGAWLIVQIADVVFEAFVFPAWIMQIIIVAAVVGFPVSLILSWTFDLTLKGIRRTDEPDELPATTVEEASHAAKKRTIPFSERRQLTVLYANLIWTSHNSEEADPEDLRAALSELRGICTSVASRFDGYVAHWLADQFVIYFGYPVAHENDAQHAARSGLAILEGSARLSERLRRDRGIGVALKIGIDTGTAVVENSGDPDDDIQVLGVVVRNADWLQSIGDDGTLNISKKTSKLISGYFYQEELGQFASSEHASKIAVFRVFHESGARTRLEAGRRITPLVGRDHEFGLLKQRWDQALAGHGQAVVIRSDAGLGKSRLVHELKQHVAGDLRVWLTECVCSPDHRNRAFHPVIEMIKRHVLETENEDINVDTIAKLEGLLAQSGFELKSSVPLLIDLLDLSRTDRYPPLQLGPKLRKRKTMELLMQLLFMRAKRQPLLFVFEDLHWADPSSMELISMIVARGPSARMLSVFTSRPETQLDWVDRTYVTQISLTPLTPSETHELLRSLTDIDVLSTDAVAKIVQNTQGNPLYIEELVQSILEATNNDIGRLVDSDDFSIPATLQGILLARLDRLPDEAKKTARLCAAIGRDFGYELAEKFAHVSSIEDFESALQVLVDVDIIYQRGLPPTAKYVFKHILLQEAAYQSLLKSERESYHLEISELLSNDFPAVVEREPELLARHLTAAGRIWEALPYWKQAGDKALRQSAEVESRRYLEHALRLLGDKLPSSSERDALELQLQISLGPALMAVSGYSGPEVLAAYRRAEELSATDESSPRMAPVLFGLWTYHVVTGRLPAALGYGQRLLGIAERTRNDDLLLESHLLLGVTQTHAGPVTEALEHLQIASDLYDRDKHGRHAYIYGQDPQMSSWAYKGSAQWWLGFPDQAGDSIESAIEYARDLAHMNSLAFALSTAARCHFKRGDFSRCAKIAGEGADISEQHGFPVWKTMCAFLQAAAEYRMSRSEGAIPLMEENLDACIEAGNSLSTAYYKSIIAEAHITTMNFAAATEHLNDAIEVLKLHVTDTDEAEVARVQGLLFWKQEETGNGIPNEAETQLRRAHDIARDARAVSWQLQTALTLARYLLAKNGTDEPAEILGEAINNITEGLELSPMQEATALYGQLESARSV